ncbi:hypothetical protein ACJ72_03912 [Emergomyces africanus]|uniref:Uncharacterized protein n=1 Tax=Emergomyces africanus TaxID=1955775 RepID=A0A1B7NY83_9EURO|nr:hypothetical protein ACJ72_03912 [Emergomyces africanus]
MTTKQASNNGHLRKRTLLKILLPIAKTYNAEPIDPATPSNAGTIKPRKALLTSYVTLSSAENREEDMIAELQCAMKREIIFADLRSQEKDIQKLVASHCGLASPDFVQVLEMIEEMNNKIVWPHGSFNGCISVYIKCPGRSLLLPARMGLKVPLSYKIGEETFLGNMWFEAVTYIWTNKNCPDIPIPKLRGSGDPGGLSMST